MKGPGHCDSSCLWSPCRRSACLPGDASEGQFKSWIWATSSEMSSHLMPWGALWCSSWLDVRKDINPFFETDGLAGWDFHLPFSSSFRGKKAQDIFVLIKHLSPGRWTHAALKSVLRLDYLYFVSACKVECAWVDGTLRTERKRQRKVFMGRAEMLFSRCCDQ